MAHPTQRNTGDGLPRGRRTAAWCACILVAAGLPLAPSSRGQAITLSSNLFQPIDGVELVTTSRWLGSQFFTGDRTYLLESVTVRLQQIAGGVAEVAIYEDAGGRPGNLIAVLGSSGALPGAPGDVVFRGGSGIAGAPRGTTRTQETMGTTALGEMFDLPSGIRAADFFGGDTQVTTNAEQPDGLVLSPDTPLWVVTRSAGGQFASAYTDEETGQGIGYSSRWAVSENSGNAWDPRILSPLFLGVSANPTTPVFQIVEFRTDYEAIASLIFSGLPMAMVQREAVFSAVRNVTRDVNTRLFRLRSGTNSPERGIELFLTGNYGSADGETVLPASGFQTDTFSGTAGVEYRLNPHIAIGAAYTHLESDVGLGLGLGEIELNGDAFTTYLSLSCRGFYADFLYSAGSFDHDVRRDTLFGPHATGTPDSKTHSAQMNLGYNLGVGPFVMGPFASLDYVTGDLDGYTESGGGTARLRVAGQNFDSLVSRIGWQVSRTFETGGFLITPQFRLGWAHEFLNRSEPVGADLVTSPFSIGVNGEFTQVGAFGATATTQRPGEDAVELGTAVGVRWGRYSVTADYAARHTDGEGSSHFVSLTGSVEF